jgi:hypothetical protein
MSRSCDRTDLPIRSSYTLRPAIQCPADLSLLRHPIAQTIYRWYRNIKPVCHHLRLSASAKGPTNPEKINFTQETLDFRCPGFSPELSLLILASSFPSPPAFLTEHLRRLMERSPTIRQRRIRSFGNELESRLLSARAHLTSELLRTL